MEDESETVAPRIKTDLLSSKTQPNDPFIFLQLVHEATGLQWDAAADDSFENRSAFSNVFASRVLGGGFKLLKVDEKAAYAPTSVCTGNLTL